MTHVDSSKWTQTLHRFSFVALFSGLVSVLMAFPGAIILGEEGKEFVLDFLRIFAVSEAFITFLLLIAIVITALLRGLGSTRNNFKSTCSDLFRSVEQISFYIPLLIAVMVFLVIGGL